MLDGISQIPALPSIVSHIVGILNSPRSGADDVAKYLEMDVGLSSKVLRLANSAYYGIPGRITSVQRAVIQLGFNAVSSIVISASVYNLFRSSSGVHALERDHFWRHSIEVALYSRVLAGQMHGRVDAEIAFTIGLLHDIGVLALDTSYPREFAEVLEMARSAAQSLEETETLFFGMNHIRIGMHILDRWGIPDVIYAPMQGLEELAPELFYRDSLVLALAHAMAYSRGVVLYPHQIADSVDPLSICNELGVSFSLESMSRLFEQEIQRADFVLNLLQS